MKKFFLGMMFALALPLYVRAASIGYTNGSCGKEYLFRKGIITSKMQGMAVKIGRSKLQKLKGCTISGVDCVFGSKNTTGGKAKVFITTQLGGTALREQETTIEEKKLNDWQTVQIDNPYVITGEEEALYVGYTAEISIYSILSADYGSGLEGCSFSYDGSKWEDMYDSVYGNANIRCVVADAPAFADAVIKSVDAGGYYKVGNAYKYPCRIFNFGTETINSFDVTVRMEGSAPVTFSFSGKEIACGQDFDFDIPEYVSLAEGEKSLSVEIGNINGGDDTDVSDNTVEIGTCFYPEDMERSLLLEGFTGQTCSGCAEGHATLEKAIGGTDMDIVEVMHHSGYYPDRYTMKEDEEYTALYNGNTYAPAFMVNRTKLAGNNSPVIEVTLSNAEYAFKELAKKRPYVSMKLETEYVPATRQVKVKLLTQAHEALPEGDNRINVVLVQDGIPGSQSNGGNNYVHQRVFRGTLTGDTWGVALPQAFGIGDTDVWEKTFTLPESVFSSYWTDELLTQKGWKAAEVTIPVVPENMYIVAYAGQYSKSDLAANAVYNCVQVKLGESRTQGGVTGITAARGDGQGYTVRVSGRSIQVTGDYDRYDVYGISGTHIPSGCILSDGIYVVRVTAKGKTESRKVIVNGNI